MQTVIISFHTVSIKCATRTNLEDQEVFSALRSGSIVLAILCVTTHERRTAEHATLMHTTDHLAKINI